MRRRHAGRVAVAAILLAWSSLAFAQPANDDCANATVLSAASLPFTELVDTSTATSDGDTSAGSSACANFANSIWYEFTAGASDVILVLDAWEGSTYEFSAVEAYTGACGALVSDGSGPLDVNDAQNLAHRVPAGTSVLLCVSDQGTTPGGGPIQVQILEAPEFEIDVEGENADSDRRAVAGGPGGTFFVTWTADVGAGEHRGQLYDATGTPIGPRLVLDATKPFWQDAAARGSDGFVAVWDDYPDVRAQLVDASGLAVGTPFTVNQTPAGTAGARVDARADGDFVVAWNSYFRLFDTDGTALGPEQTIGSSTGYWLDVASDAAGNFVVVWEDGDEIAAQRFDAAGTAAGGVLTVASGYAYRPNAAAAPTGEFLVVWEADYYNAIFGQAFDAAGAPDGPAVELSKPGSEYPNHRPSAEADASGNFVVVWEDDAGRTDYDFQIDVAGRRVGPGGTLLGPEFPVNTVNAGYQYWPAVGVAPDGEFMVVWGDLAGYQPWSVPFPDAVIGRTFADEVEPPVLDCPATAAATCRATILPGKSKLLVRNDGLDPEDLAINWKLVKAEATAAADFGDPTASDDLFFCLYDDGGDLVTQAAIPAAGLCAGKPCWKGLGTPAGAKGFKYKDVERTPNGVLKAVLKPGDAGKAKVVFKAGRGNLAAGPAGGPPAIPIAGSLTAQLHAPATGTCWGATFDATTAKRNDGGIFQASGD